MNINWNEVLNSKQFFIAIALIICSVALYKLEFNFVDIIADRVIQRMELKYSPYGPSAVPASSPSEEKSNPWK